MNPSIGAISKWKYLLLLKLKWWPYISVLFLLVFIKYLLDQKPEKIWRASWNLYSTPVLVVFSLTGGNILEEIWTQRRSSPETKPYSVLRFILGEIFTDGELLVGDRLEGSGSIPNIEFTLRHTYGTIKAGVWFKNKICYVWNQRYWVICHKID